MYAGRSSYNIMEASISIHNFKTFKRSVQISPAIVVCNPAKLIQHLLRHGKRIKGLETLASDRVSEYCADNGADKVSLTSAEEKGGKVLLQSKGASFLFAYTFLSGQS